MDIWEKLSIAGLPCPPVWPNVCAHEYINSSRRQPSTAPAYTQRVRHEQKKNEFNAHHVMLACLAGWQLNKRNYCEVHKTYLVSTFVCLAREQHTRVVCRLQEYIFSVLCGRCCGVEWCSGNGVEIPN